MLTAINNRLVFSSEITPDDPFTLRYTVQPGDSLAKIIKNLGLQVDWRFLQRINGLKRPEHIRVGQKLKIITGPFHAEIDRDNHRLDLYLGDGMNRVFVRDFLVGLGEYDCTPSGLFRVRRNSKLVNPPWTNPRSRKHFSANDPLNPIGEYWMGLEGIQDHNTQEAGFGMHGTIDPDSIGRNESMGCVRTQLPVRSTWSMKCSPRGSARSGSVNGWPLSVSRGDRQAGASDVRTLRTSTAAVCGSGTGRCVALVLHASRSG